MKTIVVLGAGNGCGNRVAEKFGTNGFKVILIARNQEHLDFYKKEFEGKGIDVAVKAVDAADFDAATKAFGEVKKEYGVPYVLFYNVGITSPDYELTVKAAKLLVECYTVDVAGAYHAINQVLGEEFSAKNGTILVTGGGFAMYPMDAYLPL